MSNAVAEGFNPEAPEEMQKQMIDAFGKKWSIGKLPRTHFFTPVAEPARSDFQIPKEIGTVWTSEPLLKDKIQAYVYSTWNKRK